MPTYRHSNKDFMDKIRRIDITDYVQTFVLSYSKRHGIKLKIQHFSGAIHLKNLLNTPENRICSPLESLNDFFYWSPQKVDFVASNLGQHRGFIFYFICIYCDSRVKYLYRYRTYESAACRKCCKLGYVPPSRKTRSISRLIRKPYFSSEDKYMLIKQIGITKKDIPDEPAQK